MKMCPHGIAVHTSQHETTINCIHQTKQERVKHTSSPPLGESDQLEAAFENTLNDVFNWFT